MKESQSHAKKSSRTFLQNISANIRKEVLKNLWNVRQKNFPLVENAIWIQLRIQKLMVRKFKHWIKFWSASNLNIPSRTFEVLAKRSRTSRTRTVLKGSYLRRAFEDSRSQFEAKWLGDRDLEARWPAFGPFRTFACSNRLELFEFVRTRRTHLRTESQNQTDLFLVSFEWLRAPRVDVVVENF